MIDFAAGTIMGESDVPFRSARPGLEEAQLRLEEAQLRLEEAQLRLEEEGGTINRRQKDAAAAADFRVDPVSDRITRITADGVLECREEVFWAYHQEIDDANHNLARGASNVHNWYKNDLGRVSQHWPCTLHEYWQRTQEVTPSDCVFS
jgi:hypothetical protein